jgi:hypothetical protein
LLIVSQELRPIMARADNAIQEIQRQMVSDEERWVVGFHGERWRFSGQQNKPIVTIKIQLDKLHGLG